MYNISDNKTSRQTPISVSTPNNNYHYVTSIGVIESYSFSKCVHYIKNYFIFSTLGQFDIGYNIKNGISQEKNMLF